MIEEPYIPANDNTVLSPQEYRSRLDAWRAAHPETDSAVLPRKARNVSAMLDDGQLDAFRSYIDLNRSSEPLQTNLINAIDRVRGTFERKFDLDTPEALVDLCCDGVDFEARIVRDGPSLSSCGYASAHSFRALKVPLDGDNVKRGTIKQDNVRSILANTDSEDRQRVLRGRSALEQGLEVQEISEPTGQLLRAVIFARKLPKMKPDSIAKMREIMPDIAVPDANRRKRAQKRASVQAYVCDEMKMPVRSVGLLRFNDNEERRDAFGEPIRLGALIGCGKRGKEDKIYWRDLRDEFSKPRGGGDVSKTWDEARTRQHDAHVWDWARHVRNGFRFEANQHGWAKSPTESGILPGPLSRTTYIFEATRQPPNVGRMSTRTDSEVEPSIAFGDMPTFNSPYDLMERNEQLRHINNRLSPQASAVLKQVLGLDGIPAQTLAKIGEGVTRKREASQRTLERNGLKSLQGAADELCTIFSAYQRLAA